MPTTLGMGGQEPGKADKLCQADRYKSREYIVHLRVAPSLKRDVSGDRFINTMYSKYKECIKGF